MTDPTSDHTAGHPRPRCLVVTKEFATLPTSGGMLRTLAIVQQLALHHDTTVVSPEGVWSTGPGRPPEPVPGGPGGPGAGLIEQTTAIPGAIARYRSISGVRTGGRRLLENLSRGAHGRYAVGVVDHTCLAGLTDAVALGCDRVVVSMHNVESDLMAQRAAATGSPGSKLAMTAETRLLRRLEAHVLSHYPVVVTTAADGHELTREHRARELIVCRNGIFPAVTAPSRNRPAHSMVFSGALDWEPNVAGVVWFAEQVWPLITRQLPDARVTVAGRNPEPRVLEACDRPGIDLLPNPPVMSTVLDVHPLGIVPLLNGSGSRIKILEYLAAGIGVISTEIGASGLEDIPDHLVERLPVDPQLFADRVVHRLSSTGTGTDQVEQAVEAQNWVRKHYAWDVTLQPLLDALS